MFLHCIDFIIREVVESMREVRRIEKEILKISLAMWYVCPN